MRQLTCAVLLLALAGFSQSACSKKEQAPSIKARGYSSGSNMPRSGESGQIKSADITTDAEGRRFEDLEFLSDGVTIRGTLALPKREDPAPAVVLIHMLGRDRSTWKDFQLLLADEGIASLAIDLRGHGVSDGGPKGYEQFSDAEWQAGISDVRNAVAALKEFPQYINVDRIGLIGASIGGNYAIQVGAESPTWPVVALSSGRNYRTVAVEEPLLKAKRQVLLAGKTDDPAAAELLEWAQQQAPEATFFEETGSEHGTDMLPNGPLEAQILAFLRAQWKVQPGEPGGVLDDLPGDLPLLDDPPADEPPTEDPAFEDFAPPDEEAPADDAGGDEGDGGGGDPDDGGEDDAGFPVDGA